MDNKNLENAFITISKEKLADLPAASFSGKITVIDNPELVAPAIATLRKAKIIGFDTETRPSFKRGQTYKVALIQLATKDTCFLFRTNIIGLPKQLVEILEDDSILKVGVSVHDDFHSLKRLNDINPTAFLDLQTYVKNYKIVDNSLSRLYAILFGERISKAQRLTNWEAAELSEAQQAYAALDAWACIKIYEFLKEGNFYPLSSPYLTFPPEPEAASDYDTEMKPDLNPHTESEPATKPDKKSDSELSC